VSTANMQNVGNNRNTTRTQLLNVYVSQTHTSVRNKYSIYKNPEDIGKLKFKVPQIHSMNLKIIYSAC